MTRRFRIRFFLTTHRELLAVFSSVALTRLICLSISHITGMTASEAEIPPDQMILWGLMPLGLFFALSAAILENSAFQAAFATGDWVHVFLIQLAILVCYGDFFANIHHHAYINLWVYFTLNAGFYTPMVLSGLGLRNRLRTAKRLDPIPTPTTPQVLDSLSAQDRCVLLREFNTKSFVEELSVRVLADQTMSAHEIAS